jgi:DNA-binding NarL/FixJ family response regulator
MAVVSKGTTMVGTIRTVFIGMSTMLRDIVMQSVSHYATLEIVDELMAYDEAADRLSSVAPELILIGLHPDDRTDIAQELLTLVPTAKVIAFSSDVSRAYLLQMRPYRVAILDISPEKLGKAIAG